MKQRVPVSQIMSKELITLNPKQSLYEAEKLFKKIISDIFPWSKT